MALRDEGEEVRREAAGELGGFEGCGEGEEEGGGDVVGLLCPDVDAEVVEGEVGELGFEGSRAVVSEGRSARVRLLSCEHWERAGVWAGGWK